MLDPGIGFGKTLEHNLALLAGVPALAALGRPVLIGVSRKGMFGTLLGREVGERLAGLAGGRRWRRWRAGRRCCGSTTCARRSTPCGCGSAVAAAG